MIKNRLFIIFVFFFLVQIAYSQNEIIEYVDFERVIENILPQQEYDVDYNDVYDRLFSLYTNPLDLNKADRSEFQSLFFLTEDQISGIVNYREEYGKFLSLFELLTIEGFDNKTVSRLSSFVMIYNNEYETLKSSLKHPEINDLFIRYQTTFEQKKGYTPPDTTSSGELTSRYAGGPNRLYARYLYSKSGNYSFGFTIEKDPGETITWDPKTERYGLDYYSFHAMVENRGIFKKIILGDFSLDFGQGLVFGSGMKFGKGYESVSTIRRNNLGLRPYRSVFEDRDFSGMAISTKVNRLEFNMFLSRVKRDAIIREEADNEKNQFISSIQTIGLHRTPTEIAAKNNLLDQTFGGNINYKAGNKRLEIGLNGNYTNYKVPIFPGIRKYNQFEFAGIKNFVGGMYFSYYLKGAHMFGEVAISKSGGKAISTGIIASLSSQVQASVHVRNYEKEFHSFYGTAFGENTKISNEKGVYWGLKILPFSNLILTTYFDLFSFPWLKYRVDKPSRGNDFMISATYDVNEKLKFRINYRNKLKEENLVKEDISQIQVLPKSSERILFNLGYNFNRTFSFQTRIQGTQVDFNESKTSGFIIAQDLSARIPRISISTRFAYFNSDNYDSRQFIYEKDLLYVYNVSAFYNTGIRYYLLTKLSLLKNIELWVKISQTKFFNQEYIGSGLEKIEGDTKTNLNAQVRFRL